MTTRKVLLTTRRKMMMVALNVARRVIMLKIVESPCNALKFIHTCIAYISYAFHIILIVLLEVYAY